MPHHHHKIRRVMLQCSMVWCHFCFYRQTWKTYWKMLPRAMELIEPNEQIYSRSLRWFFCTRSESCFLEIRLVLIFFKSEYGVPGVTRTPAAIPKITSYIAWVVAPSREGWVLLKEKWSKSAVDWKLIGRKLELTSLIGLLSDARHLGTVPCCLAGWPTFARSREECWGDAATSLRHHWWNGVVTWKGAPQSITALSGGVLTKCTFIFTIYRFFRSI